MPQRPKLPALDPAALAPQIGSDYPRPFDRPCASRERRSLGDPLDLKQFGVNLLTLPPGAWSSQRHWHAEEDEFVYVLDGEVVLITDRGEQCLGPGMAAGFPAGKPDGHHLINRSDRPALVLEVGTRTKRERAEYSDIDMKVEEIDGISRYMRKNGEPY
ncbi:MAG TPA: cupin domain-containing protein [Alphaproteobacteria bacterium]|nr:cupin domain-containing protein [Alphaproteobacteria bacterium]